MILRRQNRTIDFLLFGLGNPGPKYAGTRHNLGWWLLDLLSERFKASGRQSRHRSVVEYCTIRERSVALIRPTTFMNLSGESMRAWLKEFPDTPFAVAYDDTALAVGKVRIREKGSAGGHNGMKSIIACLGTDEILRVRIGVGHPGEDDIADYVLENPPDVDLPGFRDALRLAALCVEELVDGSVGRAQHLASGKELPAKKEKPKRVPRAQVKLTVQDLLAGRLGGGSVKPPEMQLEPEDDDDSEPES